MGQPSKSPRASAIERLAFLRSGWPSRGWSWDRRFECIASTIAIELREEAWTAATSMLPTVWTDRTLANAPVQVQEVARLTGGVRSDQYLLSADPVDGMLVYGLWWPWGGEGTNISMRIGLTGYASYDEHCALRDVFGVSEE